MTNCNCNYPVFSLCSSDQKSRSSVVRKGEFSPEEKAMQVQGIFKVMKPCNHVLEVLNITKQCNPVTGLVVLSYWALILKRIRAGGWGSFALRDADFVPKLVFRIPIIIELVQ